MNTEVNFPTCGLEVFGSQTVLIVWHLGGKSRALFPSRSDLKKLKGCCCAKR